MLKRMNAGFLDAHSMAYAAAHITGIPGSMLLSTPLTYTLTRQTHVSTLDTSLILPTLMHPLPHHSSPLDFTLTISSTSQTIQTLNDFLSNSLLGLTKGTLCGIVLFKLNTFLVMFLCVSSIDSTCFSHT
jgi:hypothetical protein